MRRLALAALAAAVLLAAVLARFEPAFESNDDPWMMAMASGLAYGVATPHLVYTHASLGALLEALYAVSPGFSWYAAYLYAVQVLAWALILDGLLALRARALSVAAFAAAFLFFGLEIALRLQFTSTAILLAAASGFHFLARGGGASPRGALLAGALFGAAGLIRPGALAVAALVGAPAFAFAARRIPRRRALLFAAAAAGVVAAQLAADLAIAATDPRWRAYREFNAARALLEVQRPEDLPAGALARAGWSENDHRLFRHWLFADPAVFSTGALRRLLREVDAPDARVGLEALAGEQRGRVAAVAGISLLALLGTAGARGRALLALGAHWVWFLLAAAALAARYARFPARVAVPLLLLMLLGALLVTGVPELRRRGRAYAGLVAAALALAALYAAAELARFGRLSERNAERGRAFERRWQQLATFDAQAVFVHWPFTLQIRWMPPLLAPAALPALRLVPLGWMVNSPPWLDHLQRLGIDDLYAALLERPDVRLLCGGPCKPHEVDWLEQYLREHRGRSVDFAAACVDPGCRIRVWQPAGPAGGAAP